MTGLEDWFKLDIQYAQAGFSWWGIRMVENQPAKTRMGDQHRLLFLHHHLPVKLHGIIIKNINLKNL